MIRSFTQSCLGPQQLCQSCGVLIQQSEFADHITQCNRVRLIILPYIHLYLYSLELNLQLVKSHYIYFQDITCPSCDEIFTSHTTLRIHRKVSLSDILINNYRYCL
jgi:hypothetical protein